MRQPKNLIKVIISSQLLGPKSFPNGWKKKQFTIGKCMLTEVGVAAGFGNPPNTWVNNKME